MNTPDPEWSTVPAIIACTSLLALIVLMAVGAW
jgi:hypothetical protein